MANEFFIDKIGRLATKDMQKSGVLASVTTAQAILESGYGTSLLAVEAKNLFGMKVSLSGNTWKGSMWDGKSVYQKNTQEQKENGEIYYIVALFRKYKSVEDSIADHSAYLTGAMDGKKLRYAGLKGERDYRTAIQIIKNGDYATDLNYVDKICEIIERFGLTKFDEWTGYEDGNDNNSGNEDSKEEELKKLKIFLCVGHGIYKNGAISSADGTAYGGVNEYKYNKALAPYVKKWLEKAGHAVTLCILPEKKYNNLNDEINYFISLENAGDYDLSIQLHLNAFNSKAYGTETYHYGTSKGAAFAQQVQNRLKTVWTDREIKPKPSLYWLRKTKATAILIESFFCDSADDYAKAKKIGMDAHGKLIAEGIHGKAISGGTSGGSSGSSGSSGGKVKYIVQAGAFSDKKNADALVKQLKDKGFSAFVKKA